MFGENSFPKVSDQTNDVSKQKLSTKSKSVKIRRKYDCSV